MRRPSSSRSRRILVFLGVVTFAQIVAFLLLRKNADFSALSQYFSSKLPSQEYEEEGITANSSIVEGVVRRIGTFWSTNNHLPRPFIYNPIDTSEITACDGPPRSLSSSHELYAYPATALPAKFPTPAAGSHDIIGINGNVCFTSSSRYGPYGWSNKETETGWPEVQWGQLQQKCLEKNQHRFKADGDESGKKKARQAVVLRGHEKFKWRPNDFIYTRSLIAELSLASGGEYEVIFMIQLNDHEHASLTSSDLRNASIVEPLKERYVPAEFRDLVIFFNTNVLKETYPKVGEWSYVMQSYQPVQWLAVSRPEFTHFWVIEQDFRVIGHNYEFFNSVGEWARKQPRDHLWERNSQLYIPAVHESWDNFVRIIEQNTPGEGVLGPMPPPKTANYSSFEPAIPLPSPVPKDWGVGEDADVISLSRIWDPIGSEWVFETYLKVFPPDTPRRTSPPNSGRFSRRVLLLTHEEQVKHGTCVAGEATNPTTALHHGLKAVYVPHPMYFDEDVDPKALYKAFSGHEAGEPFDTTKAHLGMAKPDNKKNRWERLTFSWTNELAEELYKWWTLSNGTNKNFHESPSGQRVPSREPCFPAMALHPIKDV
ncbi:hypothetical protein N431DRAFT_431489 [Stipitochalara longipes BDJ]|nr:hypothetical protein N431DRAFT_431489 [Stipitochalara longipes BDJ]